MADERLGAWRLVGLLARGGMAEIWEAERDDGLTAAVKRLPLNAEVTPTATRRFLDEGNLTVQLAHPNIVRVFEVGIERDQAYLAMERLEGLPLSRLVARPRPVGFVVGVALQLLEGLAHAHAPPFSTIHRDIKPSNLFLTRSGRLKIIDFGIASSAVLDSTRTETGHFRGSISYAAPEQARGQPLDARTDLYASGVVLRELLTGKRMYGQTHEAELLGQLLFAPVAPLLSVRPDVPPALAAALDAVLAKEPAQRPGSAKAWAETLVAALRPEEAWPPERLAAELASELAAGPGTRTFSARVVAPASAQAVAPVLEAELDVERVAPRRAGRAVGLGVAALALVGAVGFGARSLWGGDAERRPAAGEAMPAPTAAAAPQPPAPQPPAPQPPAPQPSAPQAPRAAVAVTAPPPAPGVKPKARAKPAVASGFVTVEVRPGWAQISLNGEAVGPSPVYRRQVNAGRLTVEGVRADGSRQKRTVEVVPQREAIVVLQW
ncbi:MAG: serine/threonine protein kinase [Archangiaceae bacterium]|nr:serine/threonine protein kinase [Archangiaceae bacterium]